MPPLSPSIPASRSGTSLLARIPLLLFAASLEAAFFAFYGVIGHLHGHYSDQVCHWDCGWYVSIVERGYDTHADAAGYANWAFFPLFPLLTEAVMWLTGHSFAGSATMLNGGLLFALVIVGVHYARLRFGLDDRAFVAMVLLSFPFGVYFRLPYTESLYGLVVLLTLVCLLHRRLLLAGVFAALACASRPTGALLVGSVGLVLGLQILIPVLRGRTGWRKALPSLARLAAFGAIGIGGLLAYSAYLDMHVGDPLAFSHVMHAWGRFYGNPIRHILGCLLSFDLDPAGFASTERRSLTYLAICALLSPPLIVWAAVRGALIEALFLAATFLLSTSTGLESQPRYMLCNPISIVLVASMLARLPVPLRWSAPTLFGAAQILLVFAWFNGSAFMT